MSLEESNKQKTSETVMSGERRSFLEKAKYVAPTLIALGALTKPTKSEGGFGPPPSGPDFPQNQP